MHWKDWQNTVDEWIKTYGVRYFDEKTNTLLLMEEVGELSRHIARVYGEQSYKDPSDTHCAKKKIEEEIGDVFFVLICLSNQMEIDLERVLEDNMKKKTQRDFSRHQQNPKLKG